MVAEKENPGKEFQSEDKKVDGHELNDKSQFISYIPELENQSDDDKRQLLHRGGDCSRDLCTI